MYQDGGDAEFEETPQHQNQANTMMPPWMFRHLNG